MLYPGRTIVLLSSHNIHVCIPPPPFSLFQFIITDKATSRREGVGVMNDEEFKFEEIESPLKLGGTGGWYTVVIHT